MTFRFNAMAAGLLAVAVAVPACGVRAEEPQPGADQYYSGNALYNRRLYPLAAQEYRAFLEKNARHAKAEAARMGLALCLYAMGKYGEAEPLLAQVIRTGETGNPDQLRLLRAECLDALDKTAEAEQAYTEVALAAAAAPAQRLDAQAALANLAFRQKAWVLAAERAEKVIAADAEGRWVENAFYQGAYALYQLKRTDAAIGLLKRFPPQPRDAALGMRVALLLGEIQRETGRYAEAAEQYANLLKTADPAAAGELWFRLGYVRFQAGQFGAAAEAFRKALAAQPQEETAADAAVMLGRALVEKGDFRAAADALLPLVQKSDRGKQDRNAAEAVLWLARCSSRQGKFNEAAAVLAPAVGRLAGSPKAGDLLFDYAVALMSIEKYADAGKALDEVLKIADFPQRTTAVGLHAVCLHRSGNYAGSLRAADLFLAEKGQHPASADVLFTRAENLLFLDRADEAAAAYRAFVAAHPAHASVAAAQYRIALLLHRKGAWDEVVRAAEPLLADPDRAKDFGQLGFIVGDSLFKLLKWEAALTRLAAFVDAQRPAGDKRDARGAPAGEANVDTALLEMALAHLRLGRADAAARACAQLVERFPQSAHLALALTELGRMRYEAGDLKAARAHLEKVVAAFPKAPQRTQAEYYLAWTAQAEGKSDEAVKLFAAVAQAPGAGALAADAALQAGLIPLGQEKYGEAREGLQNLLKAFPDHPQRDLATFSLGVASARQKAWREAAVLLKTLLDRKVQDDLADRALYELAWCEKSLGRKPEAAACYRRLFETYPESALADKARSELTELTFDAKEYDAVIAELRATLATLKDDTLREQAQYRLATAYLGKNDLAASAQAFEALLAAYPKSALRASAAFQAGECRMRLKENMAARDHFRAAAQGDGDPKVRESALLRLGETESQLGRWRESGEAYEALLRAFAQSKWAGRARFGMGWALEKQGDYRRALAEYGRVVAAGAKDEVTARSQFQIGECLFALKEYDKAVQEFVRVPVTYRFADWSAKAVLEMGRALEAKGDRDKALAQYREVVAKYPRHDATVVARERMDALRREQ